MNLDSHHIVLYLAKPKWRTVFAHKKIMHRAECFLLQNVDNSFLVKVFSKIKVIINNTTLWNVVIILCSISFLWKICAQN